MKHFSIRFFVITSLFSMFVAELVEARQPNIVLIFADDLGWKDVSYQGSDFYETPNLDRLTKEGMVFTQAYACGANCQPSRACLLSGLYTPRHEVYAVGSTDRGPKEKMRMTPVPNKPYLESRFVTVAESLRAAGYTTALFGKWHLADEKVPGTTPKEQGFDVTLEADNEGKRGIQEDPKAIRTLTREACRFMERNREKPFFLYLAHHAIHIPHQATRESLEKFNAKTPGERHTDPLYAATLYDMDASVQTVLDKIDALGLKDDTVVIFTSDNGGIRGSSQEPLRGGKGCYYEGGIREPFVVRWPGVVKPGTTCETPVVFVDLHPTFLEIAGRKKPDDLTLDGDSIVPLLKGETTFDRESVFWHFPGYLNSPVNRGRDAVFRSRPISVIRKGDWKLHLFLEEWLLDGGKEKIDVNNSVELYNINEDIGERTDLAMVNKPKRDELLNELLEWHEKTNAKLPTPLKTRP